MYRLVTPGSYRKTIAYLQRLQRIDIPAVLEKYGARGVNALASATPVDTGLAAGSWGYTVTSKGDDYTLTFTNTDIETGFPVSVMLQYGYGTGTGGYVQGRDYINPALRPIFDKIADDVTKAVKAA